MNNIQTPERRSPIPTIRRGVGAALVVCSLAGLAACGDDAAADGLADEACAAAIDLGAAMGQAPQDPSQAGAFAEATLVPIGAAFQEHLDGDLRDAGGILLDTYREIADGGDPALMEGPEAAAARSTIGAAVHEHCGFQSVDVRAVEYAFAGAPVALEAGATSFALRNEGVEDHEMVLVRRADGATETLEELLALPEDEAFAKIEFLGVAFGAPGTTSNVAVDLRPGTYFMICFLPQGGGEAGPPHFVGGMHHTFTVA